MPRAKPTDKLDLIVSALGKWPNGATLFDIAASLKPLPPMRNLQRWLSILVRQKRVLRVGSTTTTRYQLPPTAKVEAPPTASVIAEAIHRLVDLPLSERLPAHYRRALLERYRPNVTRYLSVQQCIEFVTAYDVGPWPEKPVFDCLLAQLCSTGLWLEATALGAHVSGHDEGVGKNSFGLGTLTSEVESREPLTDESIVRWLAQPERPDVRPDAQLLWNVRAMLADLVSRGHVLKVTPALVSEVYQRLTAGVIGNASRRRGTDAQLGLFRTTLIELPNTVYRLPTDGWTIEHCFEEVLKLASAIVDPVEQAFFLFVHLMYLQPFKTLNGVMTLLTMNVPLIASGLAPVTLSRAQRTDLLAGIRGVWELGRIELLREVFTL